MGIGISAYKNLELIDCVFDEDGEPIDPVTRETLDCVYQPYVNCDFPGREDALKHKKCYKYEESKHFFRRAYSGYYFWRNQLAELAGYPLTEGKTHYGTVEKCHIYGAWNADSGPFWELICFSDCEGVIGEKTSEKLAKDFADFQEKASMHNDPRFVDGYNQLRAAFEYASEGGAVKFS